MTSTPTPRPHMTAQDTLRLGDALAGLTKMRRETDVRLGVYDDARVQVGDNGIVFRLVWDVDNGYIAEESS